MSTAVMQKPKELVGVHTVMTPREAAEKLIPEFKKIAKRLWRTNARGIGQDLIQEMAFSCLSKTEPAPADHFLADARDAAIHFLRRERRQRRRLEFLPKDELTKLSDELGYCSHGPDGRDFDPIPFPKHPVFRILSQAV